MIAIKGKRILTITQGIVKDGVVLVEDGKILDVGNVSIPSKAEVIDATDHYVMPGMIDAHTHLGVYSDGVGAEGRDHNEMSDPFTPHLRVIDAIDPFDPSFQETLGAGITTVLVTPGSANPIGGQCSVLRTWGKTVEDMLLVENAGIKFALGENPKRVYGSRNQSPYTRMGIVSIIREKLTLAYNYLSKKKDARLKEEKGPDLNFKLEALLDLLQGKVPARFHAHKAHDIMSAIRIAEEFDIDITLEHCTEGDRVLEEIASREIPVVLSPLMNARTKYETGKRNMEIAGIMARRGILTAISTDGYSQTVKWLPINAGLAVRYGMKEEDAFKSITINPAHILGLSHRLGSLEKGKDADIVITKGHPLETRTKVVMVLVEGKVRYRDSSF